MNTYMDTVVACPLTSHLHPRWRGRIQITCANKPAEIAVDQIRTISKQRLEGMGNVYASPAGAKDRIYITGHKGVMYVIKHGTQFKILAKNNLDDTFNASPAIVENEIYLRGYKNLYCIAQK
jgi:hypothetical protein